ncbi:MAG: S8 family peptidase [Thermoplasmatota archaeon]
MPLVLLCLLPSIAAALPLTSDEAETIAPAKHAIGLDQMQYSLRDPWLERPAGRGVRVAIIDTGIDPTHPDLAGSVVAWHDFVNGQTTPYDDNGHGTHVAGILAGRGHLELDPLSGYFLTGETGVAPGADLIIAKAMNAQGLGTDTDVANAIRWCLDPDGDGNPADGASVISLSLGFADGGASSADSPVTQAIGDAVRDGAVVVVAAGNDGSNHVSALAEMPGVLVVGATDPTGAVASYSNYGAQVDVVAPGQIVSAYPDGLDAHGMFTDGYVGMAGTSMAVPLVAGTVALMMEADPSLATTSFAGDESQKAAEVTSIVRETAVPVESASGPDGGSAKELNAYQAVRAVDQGTDQWDYGFLIEVGTALATIGLMSAWARRRSSRARVGRPPKAPTGGEASAARGGSAGPS